MDDLAAPCGLDETGFVAERGSGARKRKLQVALGDNFRGPSDTIVVEAALHVLSEGFLNDPRGGGNTLNVKQARAFLWWGCWLQFHMNDEWGLVPLVAAPKDPTCPRAWRGSCALL